jgi:hypothetical protein
MSVVNCKVQYIRPRYANLEKWCKDPNNVYIARRGIVFINKVRYPSQDSPFANPFKISKDVTREQVVEKYREYLLNKLNADENFRQEFYKLKGKNLGCWCSPELCHGNVILELLQKKEL